MSDTATDAMPFSVRTVQRPREQVEDQIRGAIRSGILTAGQKLPSEVALSRDFGVSRTTVREALRSLVADGLIEKVPGAGGGSFIRLLDNKSFSEDLGHDIESLIRVGSIATSEAAAVRRLMEIPAARLAAQHRTADHLVELRRIVDREKELTVDDPEVPELDVQFHSAIGDASGNRVLAAFVVALHRVTEPVHHLDLDDQVGTLTVRQHIEIVKAIKNSDPDAAERAMLEHLQYLEQHPG